MSSRSGGPITRRSIAKTQANRIKKIDKIHRTAIIFQLLKYLRHWRKICTKICNLNENYKNVQGLNVQGFLQSKQQFEVSHTIVFGKIVGKTDNSKCIQENCSYNMSTSVKEFVQTYSDSVDSCFSAVSKCVKSGGNFDMWNKSFHVKTSCMFIPT